MPKLQDSVQFCRNIGIELTFLPETIPTVMAKDDYNIGWTLAARAYKEACVKKKMPMTQNIHADLGCVEYPSPILRSWEYSREWWHKATTIAEKMNMFTFNEKHEGGMGHIHMDMKEKEAIKILNDIKYRPYLTWIFATPNGSEYCSSILGEYLRGTWEYTTINTFSSSRYKIVNWTSRYHTLEFRAFDAADSWETQEEHIAFYQRYTQAVLKNKLNPLGNMDLGEAFQLYCLYKSDIDLCIQEFKRLIVDDLELPWNRYEWYIERNLIPAFKFGKRF